MEEQTVSAATLALSAAPVHTFEVILAAGLGLHTLVVAACIGIIFRWHRDMKTWRARGAAASGKHGRLRDRRTSPAGGAHGVDDGPRCAAAVKAGAAAARPGTSV